MDRMQFAKYSSVCSMFSLTLHAGSRMWSASRNICLPMDLYILHGDAHSMPLKNRNWMSVCLGESINFLRVKSFCANAFSEGKLAATIIKKHWYILKEIV